MTATMPTPAPLDPNRTYNRLLLLVAGLGGLLYGVDVGIIGGALPYLEATSGLDGGQLSIIVAAVLLGSVISTLFAGLLADWLGRKPLMVISGAIFVLSIPVIALSHGFAPLFFGRLLQGVSGGLVGIVVPLYLAECLSAQDRGKGTGAFQWLLTLGIFSAAVIGIYYSYRVAGLAGSTSPSALFLVKDQAWRRIFWMSMPPGILFVGGSLFVAESPRWLFRRGQKELARDALLRSRQSQQATLEMEEMEQTSLSAQHASGPRGDEGFAAATKICSPLPAGMRHSLLQHGDGNQLHYWIQHRHPAAERSVGFARALGLCALHLCELPDDHRRNDPGRPQGAQISVHSWNVRHHRFPALCRHAVFAHGKGQA